MREIITSRPISDGKGYWIVTIQINQKFPRCKLCGKLIPLRAEPRRITLADGKVVPFCSEECLQDYRRRLQAGGHADSTLAVC